MGIQDSDVESDRAIAQALVGRPLTREEAFDRRLAEQLQENEVAEHAHELGATQELSGVNVLLEQYFPARLMTLYRRAGQCRAKVTNSEGYA